MTKHAVLIGINYRGTESELNGCINDVLGVRKLLMSKFGYSSRNIKLITDDTRVKPTRRNILLALKKVVARARRGDTIYVHYSGHGYYTRNWGNDVELDGNDELICPLDQPIVDDELHQIMVVQLRKGVRLRCVFDCCHSGSVLDLPCRLNAEKKLVMENQSVSDKDVIMISGCKDNQTSADAYLKRKYQGALTWAFTTVLDQLCDEHNELAHWNWKDFVTLIRFNLRQKRFDQIPQVSSTNSDHFHHKVTM